jgi:hypothetical protein
VLFQILQFLFGSILLFDVPKDLSDICFERFIISKYTLGRIPSWGYNLFFNCFVSHEVINISLDLVESYIVEVADSIYYFSWLATKQVLVEKDIDVYRYKEVIELSSISIKNIWYLEGSSTLLYRKY